MRPLAIILLAACGGSNSVQIDAPPNTGSADGSLPTVDAPPGCTTHITYGSTWIHGGNHPQQDDTANGDVTWDGTCSDDGANSFAQLSNGWKPYFQGNGACAIALDHAASCGIAATCTTRLTYGSAWAHPTNHTAQYDDTAHRVFWAGDCTTSGTSSSTTLSNGWTPHFSGANACEVSQRWSECGGLYGNPVMPAACADPGVLRDGNRYVMSCTSGNAADAFPLYVSTDLVSWNAQGYILPKMAHPAWAVSDFWAPEIHKIGGHYVAYFSARGSDGKLAVGAASANDPLGPYTALAQPLVHDANMGLIDASEITAADGTPYLLWKEDGNAVGRPTPIHARALAGDGLSLTGTTATLITNDQSWEGAVVEGPFMVEHAGMYYLFYSGNSYASTAYAIGVARASSPLGPFTKAAAPIVTSNGTWAGPGHCSVVDGDTDTYVVYHAWQAGHVNTAPGRLPLVDQVDWQNGWPVVTGAPSSAMRPVP